MHRRYQSRPPLLLRMLARMLRLGLGLLLIGVGGIAGAQAAKCPDGSPIDGLSRAGTPRHCLVIRRYDIADPAVTNVLMVYLHGDSGGQTELLPASGTSFALAS